MVDNNKAIEVKDLVKTYDFPLFQGLSFSIYKGQRVSIVGPGGCGKSTLLKNILGLEPFDSGSITLLSKDVKQINSNKKEPSILKKVGMAFQQGALFDFMTVKENLVFAMEHLTDYTKDQMDEKVKVLLASVKLFNTEDKYPYELSGGMQKRVGIAKALSSDPELALFDEPTAGLDPVTSTIIIKMIIDMIKDKTAVICTTSIETAIRFSRRFIVINDGVVVADDDWSKLLESDNKWVSHFIGDRLRGIDKEYAKDLGLPEKYIVS